MDPFVRKLIERLADPAKPMSRNRHFHTFESPEGRQAMKIFKRLTALKRDIEMCEQEGGTYAVKKLEVDDKVQVEVTLQSLRSKRTVTLQQAELDLLERLRKM